MKTHTVNDRRSTRDIHSHDADGHPGEGHTAGTKAGRNDTDDRGRSAEGPGEIPKRGWKDILTRTKESMAEDDLSIVAAGVAFYVFLGLIPALGAVISIWGLLADPITVQEQISAMAGVLPGDVVNILEEQMTRIASQPAGALTATLIGILLALWSGAKAMKAVMVALNITYGEKETRGFIKLNATALALTFAGVIGFIVAIGVVVALPIILSKIGLDDATATVLSLARWPFLALFAMFGLSILYRYGPNRKAARWRWVSWGAFLGTVVWIAVSAGFSFYVSNFGSYNKTYGSLAAVVVLMLWFMISAYVVLLGSELNAELEHQTARDTTIGPEQPRGHRQARMSDEIGRARRN